MTILVRCKKSADSDVFHSFDNKDDVIGFVSTFASCSELFCISCFVDFLCDSNRARPGDFLNLSSFFVFCEAL